jgi:hypothetical protein
MPDNELLQEVARALRPGPVHPPPGRVKALRKMVAASETVPANGSRGGDGALVDDVARALRVGAVEPPQQRVETLRDLVGAGVAAGNGSRDGVDHRGADGEPTAGVADLGRARARRQAAGRFSRMISGLGAAAAVALVVAMVAVNQLPGALREVAHDVGLPVDSPEMAAATRDIDRLELALARRDAREVAEADGAMLRSTNKLKGEDLRDLQERAVRLHVEAVAFLRDNPAPADALSDLPLPSDPATGAAAPPGQAAPPPPGSAETPGPGPAPAPPGSTSIRPPTVATTVPPQPLKVKILSITPRLDASFAVNFEVSGFTLGPGQPHNVQFYFDADQEITTYSGPSPWKFPLLNAVKYHTVCAQVIDAAGGRVPDSGECKPILLI